MVTHDVDEALLLADRIVMMTPGPAATVGGILTVPFPRPRDRAEVLNRPDYFPLRDRLTGFLETGEMPGEVEPVPGNAHFGFRPEVQATGRVRMFPVMLEDPTS
jgi:ABC-type sulfate/molybdate transport systems ATPase subunit